MIDSHCHLEQKDYDSDRDEVIKQCKQQLKAIVTCCAQPKDFELTLKMVERHKNFVFACCGIHPEYIKEISWKEKDDFLQKIKENRDKIMAVGEIGLDFFWVKDRILQKKQKELFIELINFAKELRKPIVIHSRDAAEECIRILEQEDVKDALMHLFGEKNLIKRVADNGWLISFGPIIARSKTHKKIARDFPLESILLETDSPWFGSADGKPARGTPLNIRAVAEKIAEAKKITFEEVWKQCGKNSIRFFSLPINI